METNKLREEIEDIVRNYGGEGMGGGGAIETEGIDQLLALVQSERLAAKKEALGDLWKIYNIRRALDGGKVTLSANFMSENAQTGYEHGYDDGLAEFDKILKVEERNIEHGTQWSTHPKTAVDSKKEVG